MTCAHADKSPMRLQACRVCASAPLSVRAQRRAAIHETRRPTETRMPPGSLALLGGSTQRSKGAGGGRARHCRRRRSRVRMHARKGTRAGGMRTGNQAACRGIWGAARGAAARRSSAGREDTCRAAARPAAMGAAQQPAAEPAAQGGPRGSVRRQFLKGEMGWGDQALALRRPAGSSGGPTPAPKTGGAAAQRRGRRAGLQGRRRGAGDCLLGRPGLARAPGGGMAQAKGA